ncbi:MAG: DUF4115 domain-containing protein [Emcibacteraceae bacterium]|nr:DUF4115 domain-containing protein [Emcibacteraceae bacterium]MDG1995916.1 DUF4115 domain-containing protein [Emcibacteraceae bacterium]
MNKICTEIKADQQAVNVGDLLRGAREEHHVRDLNAIARELCIKAHLLEALEEGKFDSFPSACYATGFLKNYAAFLGLDTKDIISKYEKEYAGLNDIVVLTFPEVKKSKFSLGKLLGTASFSVALIMGVWMTSSTFDTQDISKALMPTKVEAAVIVPEPAVKETQEDDIVLTSIIEETIPEGISTSFNNSIQLKAKDDVWVRITKEDGTTVVEQILAKGETFNHPQEAGLVLMTNDAGAISISMGSNNVNSLGAPGEIIENMALEQEKMLEFSMVR